MSFSFHHVRGSTALRMMRPTHLHRSDSSEDKSTLDGKFPGQQCGEVRGWWGAALGVRFQIYEANRTSYAPLNEEPDIKNWWSDVYWPDVQSAVFVNQVCRKKMEQSVNCCRRPPQGGWVGPSPFWLRPWNLLYLSVCLSVHVAVYPSTHPFVTWTCTQEIPCTKIK